MKTKVQSQVSKAIFDNSDSAVWHLREQHGHDYTFTTVKDHSNEQDALAVTFRNQPNTTYYICQARNGRYEITTREP